MNAALSHSPNFYSEPLPFKNPYNNVVFKKSDLYNFYFFIKSGLFIISDLIQNYFLSNFDLYDFQQHNEYIIRDYYIKSYINTTPVDELFLDVKFMLKYINISKRIYIHSDFPKSRAVEIMRPYLLLYYQSIYSVDSHKRNISNDELVGRLTQFINFNPLFGRRYIQSYTKLRTNQTQMNQYKLLYIKKVEYNDKHLQFNSRDIKFMTSHITTNDDV